MHYKLGEWEEGVQDRVMTCYMLIHILCAIVEATDVKCHAM